MNQDITPILYRIIGQLFVENEMLAAQLDELKPHAEDPPPADEPDKV